MQETTVAALAQAHEAGATVLDVRETDEYVEGHVPGALHIPLGQLSFRAGEVPPEGMVYVICRSGVRSQTGAEILESYGLQAVSVASGTLGWVVAGHPVVTGPDRG